ncbi:hypothetical protein B0H10DRAFT_1946093 [Mycena sp. CBHHK59/15]|nr:hypothetical protein B0H10DRAFT_1946093 [Mycena sp. CBHHK59/15]
MPAVDHSLEQSNRMAFAMNNGEDGLNGCSTVASQTSHSREGEIALRIDGDWPTKLAHPETWVYENLPHKQGLCYIELAWAMVLEYIPGMTLVAFATDLTRTLPDTCDVVRHLGLRFTF